MWLKIVLVPSIAFFTLGVASCPRKLPEPPKVYQCSINWPDGGQPALYCVEPETGECMKGKNGCNKIPIRVDVEEIKGSQCLLPWHYVEMSNWWDQVLDIAQKRCQ